MDLAEMQAEVAVWHEARWPDRAGMRGQIMLKLVAEVGELADALCLPTSHTKDRDRGDAPAEMADVLTVLLALAALERVDLSAVWRAKFDEVVNR